MTLLRVCRCGQLIPATRRRCAACDRADSTRRRNKPSGKVYADPRWKKTRQVVLQRDGGENAQEGFLVVSGECVLIVESEQRRLGAWDYFHCPSGTEHVIVGSGNTPAVVLAVGARGRGRGGGVVYRVCEAAARYGASVQRDTTDASEAYRKAYEGLPRSKWIPYRDGLLPDA
jgi:mannose-6-phosphate isomerase-like protein (cupin superfamily)